jgi:hypothetical protein
MKKIITQGLIFLIVSISSTYGQQSPVDKGFQAITTDAIQAQLGFLTSDWTEGRMTGEKGEFLAADYIASMLQLCGVKPFGDYLRGSRNSRSYFQNFVLLKTSPGNEPELKIKSENGTMLRTTNLAYNVDFSARPSDQSLEIEAPVVFAGYGVINEKLKYNDFSNLDVKGKFVLKIAGVPAFISDLHDQAILSSTARDTEAYLRKMGAAGIIEFNPSVTVAGTPERKEFMNMSPSEVLPRGGDPSSRYSIPVKSNPSVFVRIGISARAANEILDGNNINLEYYIKKAATGEPVTKSPLNGKSVYLKTSVQSSQVSVRNILGVIEGKNPNQVIILGAHYDHMGIGAGYIWNGADDNGSGTVGVMTLARALMATGVKPEKTIVIALWTAEEEGLLGSRYFVQNSVIPVKNIALNLNFDMISRYISNDETKKVTMTYTASYPVFKDITIANLRKYGIDLDVDYQPSDDPPGGTDHRSFVAAGVPVMRFKPGHREEYHTPYDEVSTTDWDIMEKIIKISYTNIWELANEEW